MSGVAFRPVAFRYFRRPGHSLRKSAATSCCSSTDSRASNPSSSSSRRRHCKRVLRIRGNLLDESLPTPLNLGPGERLIPTLSMQRTDGALSQQAARLADIVPWFAHNALVHYLSPRGLEQYSGGGWGTRDVCQGPVEMLLALDRTEPMRDLLLRVMAQQNPDGDWPQWFMFFERERDIRPGDSHGDIVFWPLLVLAQYLLASGDAALLEQSVPFFDPKPAAAARARDGLAARASAPCR